MAEFVKFIGYLLFLSVKGSPNRLGLSLGSFKVIAAAICQKI
jgi:hypothetical protein